MKILFIVKNRQFPYTQGSSYSSEQPFSSGLFNSTRFVVNTIPDAVLESAIDNNCIDRLVTEHQPTHVIIEALWVVPEKFATLQKLHPRVRWAVRLHSEMPFLAGEGVALEWIHAYRRQGVRILANSPRMAEDLGGAIYTPNTYPAELCTDNVGWYTGPGLHVGCFGALRPLKNQLAQAVAAIKFANDHNMDLAFHINGTRSESGDAILRNLRALFARYRRHRLVEHSWYDHACFRDVVSQMDILLQVSFSETYNIVAADAVSQLVPVVTSGEIPFVARPFLADPTSISSIVKAMNRALTWGRMGARINQFLLRRNSRAAAKAWRRAIERLAAC